MTQPSSPIVEMADARFDYVTVGHVTRDEIECSPGGAVAQPGGGAFYSALQAARLGLRTLIVTQGVPGEIEELLAPYRDELDVHVIPAARTTTLSTHGSGATRSQRVLAWAGAILQPIEVSAAILHLTPIARETPVSWRGGADFVGITPQGLIRRWEEHHSVPLVQLDAASLLGDTPTVPFDRDPLPGEISSVDLDPTLLPERFDAAVISEHECHSAHALFVAAQRHGAHVAVTAGSRPTTVHLCDPGAGPQVVQTAIPRASAVRDDLGAGDVFAAAFFVALAAGRSPLNAATFGNAAATVRIAGVGPSAIGRRETIEALTHASETDEEL
ncbi:MAG TPA: PfkB family carbohydrate kinase [Solirubrobacteraceae bacterium]